MKIVIDIDDESYEHIKKYANEEILPIGWYQIINGTPLPKGHGRLQAGCADEIYNLPSVKPQPFINKPCISEGVCREDKIQVLDKIKEEIRDNTYFINEITEKEGIDFETVEKIIDKYKVESEG